MKKQCTICRINNCYLEEGEDVSQCPINKFLALFGGKRDLIVLLSLEQPQRFGQLKKIIVDISEKMLIQTLHKLEDQ
jgi:DNA-binding HxlR family transcriptional regulator